MIGEDYSRKNVIFLGLKKYNTNLNIQERIWLESIAYFSSILIENFQRIEDLFQKIEQYKDKKKRKVILLGYQDFYSHWQKKSELIYRLIYMIRSCKINCSS